MLPVMALCWAGLFLRFRGIESALDAAVEARRDTWMFSAAGCEGKPPPGVTVACLGGGTDGAQPWMQVLSQIPFVGWLIGSVIGFEFEKIATRSHDAPILLGGGTRSLRYPDYLVCNEKSRDAEWVLKAMLCQMVGSMGLSMKFAVDGCPEPPDRGNAKCD
jgi:hypothetical protein